MIVRDVVTASVTPTLDTNVFADKDLMHATVMEFTNMARRAGGSGWITLPTLYDTGDIGGAVDLWLLTASPTNSTLTANSAITLHDTDLATVIDVVQFVTFHDAVNGQVSTRTDKRIHYVCASGSTSVFGLLVARNAGTYAAGGLTAKLTAAREE